MQQYIIQRILLNIPVLLLVISIVFFATRLQPDFAERRAAQGVSGSDSSKAVEQIRKELGTDKPLYEQYGRFLADTFRGDFGNSFISKQPVLALVKDRMQPSIELAILQLLVAVVISVPIGVVSAIRQDSPVDYVLRVVAITGVAIPSFYLAVLLMLVSFHWFNWIPPLSASAYKDFLEDPAQNLKHLLLPALAGGLAIGAGIMRILRSQMLEVLRQDYVRTAWAKGLRERTVIVRHALKNAFIPVLTVMGLELAILMSGEVVLESIFGIPGLGPLAITAMTQNDLPLIYGVVLVTASIVVVINLLVDVAYGWLDPRIRFG